MENNPEVGKIYWKCSGCGYTLQAKTPPDQCPSCNEKCEFVDVTCYTPECGFQGIDPRLQQ
jgi:rubrerythrin